MVIKWTKGKLKNIKVPRAKSRNPYGHIEVVASKDQKIKPKERKPSKPKKVVVAAGGGTQVKAENVGRVIITAGGTQVKPKNVGRVIVTAGGTQVKPRKIGKLRASSILFSPIKDSLKKAKRVLDTKELVKKVRTKK